jgi:hypothetical protein
MIAIGSPILIWMFLRFSVLQPPRFLGLLSSELESPFTRFVVYHHLKIIDPECCHVGIEAADDRLTPTMYFRRVRCVLPFEVVSHIISRGIEVLDESINHESNFLSS